jgi:DNA-binding NarL/FixJ family response regulator
MERPLSSYSNRIRAELVWSSWTSRFPGISGAELFDALRGIRPNLRVILSTAYSRETAMLGFSGRDVSGFIRKPYRSDDLERLLRATATADRTTSPDGCSGP